jgi:hypothetical protein
VTLSTHIFAWEALAHPGHQVRLQIVAQVDEQPRFQDAILEWYPILQLLKIGNERPIQRLSIWWQILRPDGQDQKVVFCLRPEKFALKFKLIVFIY